MLVLSLQCSPGWPQFQLSSLSLLCSGIVDIPSCLYSPPPTTLEVLLIPALGMQIALRVEDCSIDRHMSVLDLEATAQRRSCFSVEGSQQAARSMAKVTQQADQASPQTIEQKRSQRKPVPLSSHSVSWPPCPSSTPVLSLAFS